MHDMRLSTIGAAALLGVLTFTATGCSKESKAKTSTDEKGTTSELTPRTISVSETTTTGPSTVEITGPVSFTDAESAFESKRYDEAVRLFRGYTTQKPENPWGHYMLGLSAWKAKDFDQSEGEFLKAIELDPSHVKSKLNLARVYLDKGEAEKAVEHVDAALLIDSTSVDGFRVLGRVHDEMGKLEEAADAYRMALKLDGEDAWSMNNLGQNLIRQNKPAEALGVLALAVQVKPDNALFLNNLGMALELNGYFVKAAEVYQKAIDVDSGYQKAIDNLARVTGHEDAEGVTAVDLELLARNFASEVEGVPVPAEVTTSQPE